MKKSFTLIELLVVVAIIGILAAVGIPMFNGFITNTKITAAEQNHNNIRNLISLKLQKCASEGGQIKLLHAVNQHVYSSCNKRPDIWASFLDRHFSMTYEWVNPYNGGVFNKLNGSKNPKLGMLYFWHTKDSITMITNIGDEDGNNKYITNSIFVE